jgi:hypothetical protein
LYESTDGFDATMVGVVLLTDGSGNGGAIVGLVFGSGAAGDTAGVAGMALVVAEDGLSGVDAFGLGGLIAMAVGRLR